MPTSKILKLMSDGSQTEMVVCELVGGEVVCSGNENLITFLEERGVIDYDSKTGQKLFPKDGAKFLKQLPRNFNSTYYNATFEED